MLDLNDIALFVQVVRHGSFAETARRLGLPPNTVSRRVQALESQLGSRLLQRSTRKLTLTQAGHAFHARCAAPVDGLLDAGQEFTSGRDEASGLVRVAAPADFFDIFLMPWVAEFLAAHPRVRLDFVLSDARIDLIAERIDVAFRGGALQDSNLVGRQILPARSDHLLASPAYLEARGAPATLQDLTLHDCVAFTQASGQHTFRLTGPGGEAEDVQVVPRFSADTAQALRKATLAGLGIALLPSTMSRRDVSAGRLVPVLTQYQRTSHGLHALYPSRRQLPLAVSALIALVTTRLADC